MVFSVKYVQTGRVFGETTIYFMALLWEWPFFEMFGLFWAIFGYFEPHLGTQNMRCFSPALFYLQWLTVTSFHALTYIIYKKYHFLPKFSPNGGHLEYLHFSKYVFTGMYVGMVFWEKTIYFMALIRKKWPFF